MKKAMIFFLLVILLLGCSTSPSIPNTAVPASTNTAVPASTNTAVPASTNTAASPRITHVVAFGDEFSDNGNGYKNWNEAAENGKLPPMLKEKWAQNKLGLWQGRWSNGPVAVDVLADRLKVGLTNYAVVGAISGSGDYLSEMADLDIFENPGLFGQIDNYETELDGKKADPDSLHFIQIGMVDISSKLEKKAVNSDQAAERVADQVIGNLGEAVTRLAKLGAKQFMVGNSLDYSTLPGIARWNTQGKAKAFQARLNSTLPEEMEKLAQELDVKIDISDFGAIEKSIRSNPEQYGLTQLDEPCTKFAEDFDESCASPDEYYYYGYYFLTSRVHQIMGEAMADQLSD